MIDTTSERFWAKVDKSGDCWLWTAACNRNGYGFIRYGTTHKVIEAHRVSYMLTYGDPPKGFDVCHKCDTPRCVNPNHLFLGTRRVNIQDSVRKGRHGKALTPEIVQSIRADIAAGIQQTHIAKQYGVGCATISKIATGKAWTCLDSESPTPLPLPTQDTLTAEQIDQVRYLHKIGVSEKRLSELFKTSCFVISDIASKQEPTP